MSLDPYEKFKHFRMSGHHPQQDFMEAPDAYGFYEIGIVHGAIREVVVSPIFREL